MGGTRAFIVHWLLTSYLFRHQAARAGHYQSHACHNRLDGQRRRSPIIDDKCYFYNISAFTASGSTIMIASNSRHRLARDLPSRRMVALYRHIVLLFDHCSITQGICRDIASPADRSLFSNHIKSSMIIVPS